MAFLQMRIELGLAVECWLTVRHRAFEFPIYIAIGVRFFVRSEMGNEMNLVLICGIDGD